MNVFKSIFFFFLFSLEGLTTIAQSKKSYDSDYYTVFPRSISERVFASKKYNQFTLRSTSGNKLKYLPNNSLAAGIGFSYNNLSINIAYGLSFLNNKEKGKTKSIDLQAHLYSRRWINDFYAQQYRGFYSSPHNYISPQGTAYYVRPDIVSLLLGFSRYRVFNSKRFSFRAAFLQTERQKRSAGSLLAGFEIYYSKLRGDSSFVPETLKQFYSRPAINKINYVSLGPGIGYAYTLVFGKHFFATGSIIGNLNLNYVKEYETAENSNHISWNPLINFRTAAGYNGKKWSICVTWIAVNLRFGENTGNRYLVQPGNYRFIIARRFTASKNMQKKLRAVDRIFKEGKDKMPGGL